VTPDDLSLLLSSFGTTFDSAGDFNTWAYGNVDHSTDGLVGASDLSLLIGYLGMTLG
jgi:hypothetical protein